MTGEYKLIIDRQKLTNELLKDYRSNYHEMKKYEQMGKEFCADAWLYTGIVNAYEFILKNNLGIEESALKEWR